MASTQLALRYSYNTKPSTLLNSLFMTTVNTAARSLLAVANTDNTGSWKLMDHAKYMFMLTTWTTVWFLKVLVDYFPISIGANLSNSPFLLEGISSVGSSILSHLASFSSSSKSYASTSSAVSSLDLVLYQGSDDVLPEKFLGGSLSHILAMLNELPASTRKYQFAVAMADRIVDEGTRDGDAELCQINRVALASAFASTSNLLYCSLSKRSNTTLEGFSGTWSARIIGSLPFGSVIVKGLGAVLPLFGSGGGTQRPSLALESAYDDHIMAEKHVQELLWLTNKMRFAGVVDEALLQWSFANGLSSISLTANPRVQGFLVKISAILFGELARGNLEAPDQVKFRLLALWLPLFCFAENGLSYPILTNYEKAEMERILNQIISTLSLADQHVILTNWMQDFLHSTSDWPNLQLSFDRWCQSCRKVIKAEKVNMEQFNLIE